MKNQIISIITINYNNIVGLKKTAESILNQTNKNFEWIVIDGGSTDGAYDYLKSISTHIDYWCSEKDNGIYHAMNKGTSIATGKYCLYMNSGDCMFDNNVIQKILSIDLKADIINGRGELVVDGVPTRIRECKKSINLSDWVQLLPFDNKTIGGNTLLHQATLIRRKCILETPYDEKLRVASDYKFWLEGLVLKNYTYEITDIVICSFDDLSGVSSNPATRYETHTALVDVIPKRILDDYVDFLNFKKHFVGKVAIKIYKWVKRWR